MSSPSPTPSYLAVLRAPHAVRTFAAAMAGRFSYGIVFIALTVALTQATGSYGLAGTAIALFGLGTLLLAPARAGLIDRHGPRHALPPMAIAYAILLAGLTAATWRPDAPGWLLLALSVAAGACAPPLGPVMRTLWSNLLPDPALRQRAFALDTVAEELLYVAGPLVAGLFIALDTPALGIAASAFLVLAGTLAMVSSPLAGRWPTNESGRNARSVRPGPRLPRGIAELSEPVIVISGVGTGMGGLSLLVVAFAEHHHRVAAVAWIEATLAAGSAIGGIVYGARTWRLSQRTRLPLLGGALAMAIGVAGFSPGIPVLVVVVGFVGLFVAPALSTAYLVADLSAPPSARTRAATWVNMAFNAGSSGGVAVAGLLLNRLPLSLCFLVVTVPALLSAAAVLVRVAWSAHSGLNSEPDDPTAHAASTSNSSRDLERRLGTR
ncbi:Predicted arabinose efflux permease, MFS family [Micromonospora viridifaciens]|uniref:Predicted arabinose efflux permease, MFS family n=2 Tax=Micromonospora viridifaciens TaxID=1881 RepID=A0A1C4XB82_MICVI|nr:Predicted arabinose efflux permease, MFS family [Micromonospora viridifaciens]